MPLNLSDLSLALGGLVFVLMLIPFLFARREPNRRRGFPVLRGSSARYEDVDPKSIKEEFKPSWPTLRSGS